MKWKPAGLAQLDRHVTNLFRQGETDTTVTAHDGAKPVLGASNEPGAAERRLLAVMPLHAITSVHGEAGLRERLLV